jgi:eukaryotic-like serine/threonine-protein kinase
MQNIGRFNVKKILGSGSQGTVFLCVDPQLQRDVAIKLLDGKHGLTSDDVGAFLSEARAISRIQHPNIVSIYDVDKEKNKPYLVFEYVKGELLSDRLKRKQADLHESLDIFTGILSGVAQVHKEGIVHRDLKPANIILDSESMPKIMDFGIARMLKTENGRDTDLTGTPRYMAPEYISHGRVSPQMDVFALGAILYELVSGKRAFNGNNSVTLLNNIKSKAVVPASSINREVGERLDAIILKALDKDPGSRFTDAGEMLRALIEYREASDQQQGDKSSSKGTVEFLLRRMQRQSDFPALSESIRTLNRLTSSEDENVNRLASVIMSDFALVNKLLKVVNSAYYSRFAGKIGTVSRAIVVLGVRTIRSIAASLIFFEHLHNKAQATQLKNEIASAIYSAAFARQTAENAGMEHVEESFLCGMLHNLGKILVTYYLHGESEEVARLVNQEDVPQEQAEKKVLGMTFGDIGIAIAKQWNFPDTITSGMIKIDPTNPGDLTNSDVRLRCIANFANEATSILGSEQGQDEQNTKELLKRYRIALAVTNRQFDNMAKGARVEFRELSGSLIERASKESFVHHLYENQKEEDELQQPEDKLQESTHDLTQTLQISTEEVKPQNKETSTEPKIEQESENAEAVLTEGLQEVTYMLLEDQANLSQIFNVVIETIYRAFAYDHVILALQDRKKSEYCAKMGFGTDVDKLIPNFHFPIVFSSNVFHAAIQNDVDLYIGDAREKKIQVNIPEWHKKASKAGSFFIFPLVVNQRPLGLIYADHAKPNGIQLSSKQLNLIKTLRNQIILAIKSRA